MVANWIKATTGKVDIPAIVGWYLQLWAKGLAVAPVSKEDFCTVCGVCVGLCPTGAISIAGSVITKTDCCIRCCACIKNCPEQARIMEDETWKEITNWLSENCRSRKEPQLFGVAE
jgi:ferredoxin